MFYEYGQTSSNGNNLSVIAPLVPMTYLSDTRVDGGIFNDPAFSVELISDTSYNTNVNCTGRVLSDSIQFSDNKTLTNGKPLTFTMEELDFYPTKVIFTASHLTVIDSNNMKRYLKDLTLVAYDGENLQDDNSTNVYYDPYGDIFIKMILVGNKLVFITDRNITVHFYGTDKITLDGSVRTNGVCDIINRDYRFTAYMDQSIKPIEFIDYKPEITVDGTNYPKYLNLASEFDILSNSMTTNIDCNCSITDLDTNENYEIYCSMYNISGSSLKDNNDTSRYRVSSYNSFFYKANETHSFMITFKFIMGYGNIMINSKPFIIKGNIGLPEEG